MEIYAKEIYATDNKYRAQTVHDLSRVVECCGGARHTAFPTDDSWYTSTRGIHIILHYHGGPQWSENKMYTKPVHFPVFLHHIWS